MAFTDLLIIYLTFGAPVAVYKYLQLRRASARQRILISATTFVFWIPAAARIVYLYLTNAYFIDGFVSSADSDSGDRTLAELREATSAALARVSTASDVHEVRDTVDRYVGLANSVRAGVVVEAAPEELFKAAGRKEYELGRVCLMRRNMRRLESHHSQARKDLVALFRVGRERGVGSGAIGFGISLAQQLGDGIAVTQLKALEAERTGLWNSEQQDNAPAIAAVSPIAMTIASVNKD